MTCKRIQPIVIFWCLIILVAFPACNFLQPQSSGSSTSAPAILPSESMVANTVPIIPQASIASPITSLPMLTATTGVGTIHDTPQVSVVIPATSTPLPLALPTQQALPMPTLAARLYTVVDVETEDVLNIRSEAGISNPIIGVIPPYAMGVRIVGPQVTTGDGALWASINYQGLNGWVNTRYLAQQIGSMAPQPAKLADQVIMALKNKDFQALSNLAHPLKGVRFSPYAFVRDQDLVFRPDQVPGLFADPTSYTWGAFDGSGQPIRMTFQQYYQRFIYDANFSRPEMIAFNQAIGSGNTINNISEFYPGDEFVEYHFSMLDPQYEGLDWRSLRIVLEQFNGEWYLVGVIHAEWTI